MNFIPKAIFSYYPKIQVLLNPAYEAKQSYDSLKKDGSRNYFGIDCSINGEYFRSRTDNQYFNIIFKDIKIKEIKEFDYFFPSTRLCDIEYDSTKHVIIRLEFNKDKSYFVERNQCISVKNPDVTILNNVTTIEELLSSIPTFVNLL
jgi:hypothetical protein